VTLSVTDVVLSPTVPYV